MQTCEWFAACDNDADGVVSHPIGWVPTCERCATKLGLDLRRPNDALDVWLRHPDDDEEAEEAEAEANTYADGDVFRVDWSLTSVGLIKSVTFARYDEARAWLEQEGFQDYTS